jgi:hypothetical protein
LLSLLLVDRGNKPLYYLLGLNLGVESFNIETAQKIFFELGSVYLLVQIASEAWQVVLKWYSIVDIGVYLVKDIVNGQ